MIVSYALFLLIAVVAGAIDHMAMARWLRSILTILCYFAMVVVLVIIPVIFPIKVAGLLQFLAQTPVFVLTMIGLWYGGYRIGGELPGKMPLVAGLRASSWLLKTGN